MTDKDEILAAIASGNDGLIRHIDESFNALAAILTTGFDRLEKRLGTIEGDCGRLMAALDRIETRLDDHERRIAALEVGI